MRRIHPYYYVLLFARPAFLFIPTIAIWTAGCQRIFPDKLGASSGFTHAVVQPAHGRNQLFQSQLFHKGTDTAFAESCLIPASVRILIEVHIPGIGISVLGSQLCRFLHSLDIFRGILSFRVLSAKPFHKSGHRRFHVIHCRLLNLR